MKPFDGNEYRKRVMSRLLEDFTLADPHTGDPFLTCDVDSDATAGVATHRLDDVVAFWQKDRNHPKYKGIAAQLVARRPEYAFVLTDPTAHAVAVARITGTQRQTDTHAVEQLDKLAVTLLKRHRGIPRTRVAALSSIATSDGMTPGAFAGWLEQHQIIEDSERVDAAPWEPSIRRQVRRSLDELALIDPALKSRYRTLLTFLGVGVGASKAELSAAHTRLSNMNRTRPRDRITTLTEDLLAQVSTRLMAAGGVPNYVASLHSDAQDSLMPDLRNLAILTGSLAASEMEAFSASIMGLEWGLTTSEARDLVRAAAHEMHLAVEVAGEVELVVCRECHRPQAVGQQNVCSYCRAQLYTDCPACRIRIPAACDVCPSCSASLASWRAAAAATLAVRAALDAGLLIEASHLATEALTRIDSTAAPAPLQAIAAAVADLLQCAAKMWADLHRNLDAGALWAAAASATWLVHNASDYPDPTSVPANAATGAQMPMDASAISTILDRRKRVAVAAAEQAVALPTEQARAALALVLRSYSDCPAALAALAALPLAPPQTILLILDQGVARISWKPASTATRTAKYRIDRHITWPPDQIKHTAVGTTSMNHFEDGGAPAGTQVTYTVTTLDQTRSSEAVSTGTPRFVERDIQVLHADVVDGTVILSWPSVGLGLAEVVIVREVDPESGFSVPTRRMRPRERGRLVDSDVSFEVPYLYSISLTFRTPGGRLVRTDGSSVAVKLRHPPRPVAEIWASTDETGNTTVWFRTPPSGLVRVYASLEASNPFPVFRAGTVAELKLAASGLRLVGEGRRRVMDTDGRGVTVYQAVTVVETMASVGAILRHTSIAKPSRLVVLDDNGRWVRISFELPPGVTEAFVVWRRDRYPTVVDDPATASAGGGATKVTNTKLSIDGGYSIDAPDDGRPLFVAVFPALRAGRSAPARPAPVAATLQARTATK